MKSTIFSYSDDFIFDKVVPGRQRIVQITDHLKRPRQPRFLRHSTSKAATRKKAQTKKNPFRIEKNRFAEDGIQDGEKVGGSAAQLGPDLLGPDDDRHPRNRRFRESPRPENLRDLPEEVGERGVRKPEPSEADHPDARLRLRVQSVVPPRRDRYRRWAEFWTP